MSHFAKIVQGKVARVIKADQDFMDSFVDDSPGRWIETFKDRSQRTHFAGINFTYDEDRDAFIAPKPYNSWTLNETTCQWDAPVVMPELTQEQIDNKNSYSWNEETKQWELNE